MPDLRTTQGDYNIQKGVITFVQENRIGVNRRFIVNQTTHNLKGANEIVTMKLNHFEGNLTGLAIM